MIIKGKGAVRPAGTGGKDNQKRERATFDILPKKKTNHYKKRCFGPERYSPKEQGDLSAKEDDRRRVYIRHNRKEKTGASCNSGKKNCKKNGLVLNA